MKNKRKGFTMVELVIVIAVIAILAAVLVPTFVNIVNKANESNAMQSARIAYTNYMVEEDYIADTDKDYVVAVDSDENGSYDMYFAVDGGQFGATAYTAAANAATATGTGNTVDTNATPVYDGEGGVIYSVTQAA